MRGVWAELYPDKPWPGLDKALDVLAEEVQTLRLLSDSIVAASYEDATKRRSHDEIQRAHDIVGQYCVEADDAVTFEHVSALCWVLRHDHNSAFAQILESIEERLVHRGLQVFRFPKVVDPAKGGGE